MKLFMLFLLLPATFFTNCLFAQTDPVFQKEKISDKLYRFSASKIVSPPSIMAFVGDDGVLLIDTGRKNTAEALKKEILALGKGDPKIIIITHGGHNEHFEGNIAFEKEPLIIAHSIAKKQMESGVNLFQEYPSYMLPDLTIDKSEISLFFNGEEIKIIPLPGGHDESDIVVWFTKSKIVCVGGLSSGNLFPYVSPSCSVLVFMEQQKKLIAMLPDDVTIHNGHGEKLSKSEYTHYYTEMHDFDSIIFEDVKAGKTNDEIKADPRLQRFASYSNQYTQMNDHIDRIIAEHKNASSNKPVVTQKDIYQPLYQAYKTEGVKSLVQQYKMLKKDTSVTYEEREAGLFNIAYLFRQSGKIADSAAVAETFIEEFPKSQYLFYAYFWMGKNEQQNGNTKKALKLMKKALDLSPNHPTILATIKELESK